MVGSGTVKMALFSKFLSLLIVAHLLPSPEKGGCSTWKSKQKSLFARIPMALDIPFTCFL